MAWICVLVSAAVAALSYFVCAHVRATSLGLVSAVTLSRSLEIINGGHPAPQLAVATGYVLFHTIGLSFLLPAAFLLRRESDSDSRRSKALMAKMAAVSPPLFLIAEPWFWAQLLLTLGVVVLVARARRGLPGLDRVIGLYATVVWLTYAAMLLVGPVVPLSEMP